MFRPPDILHIYQHQMHLRSKIFVLFYYDIHRIFFTFFLHRFSLSNILSSWIMTLPSAQYSKFEENEFKLGIAENLSPNWTYLSVGIKYDDLLPCDEMYIWFGLIVNNCRCISCALHVKPVLSFKLTNEKRAREEFAIFEIIHPSLSFCTSSFFPIGSCVSVMRMHKIGIVISLRRKIFR